MRALLSVLLWSSLLVFKRHWRLSSLLIVLLSSFFILFPYSILGLSFWFSFGAVGIIIFYAWRFPPLQAKSFWQKCIYAIKLQLFLSFCTLPIIAIVFDTLPMSSFIANLLMIPIVTFLLVPLCLIAAVIQVIFAPVLPLYELINCIIGFSFSVLEIIDKTMVDVVSATADEIDVLTQSILHNTLSNELIKQVNNERHFPLLLQASHQVFTAIFILLALLPHWPNKKRTLLSCVSIFGLCLFIKPQLSTDSWALYAMDVGQGSALIIENSVSEGAAQKQYMLYDTGNAGSGYSMAETVLLPFFEQKNVDTFALLMLSHLDKDHAGGKDLIEQKLHVLRSAAPNDICNVLVQKDSSQSLQTSLRGLQIQILWPLIPMSGHENNESCVVKLSDSANSILLTGDIEKSVEAELVDIYSINNKRNTKRDNLITLQADVLIAPHHGSKTSSSIAFLEAVNPQHVIFTSAYQNRWGFPNDEVTARYQNLGINILNTAYDGRIKIVFSSDDPYITRYREDEYERWYFKAPQ
jgi:competence protein ComEC